MRIGIMASAFLVVLLASSVEAQVPPAAGPAVRLEATQEKPGVSVAQLGGATIDKPQAATPGGWYFDLSGQGSYLSGRKNFIFGTEQGPATASGFPTVKEFSFNLNGSGGGGSGAVGYWLTQTLGLELSLSGTQQSLSKSDTCTTSSGLLPVIKGQTAANGMINFDCVEATGQLFQERFGYSQRFLDSHLDVRFRVWESPDKRTALELVGGVAYTNVYQTFNMSGCCEAANGTSARLSTDINVTDNLVGGRLGLRANHGFGGGLRVFGAVMTDLYQRLSNLNSTQNATNICYDGGPCAQSPVCFPEPVRAAGRGDPGRSRGHRGRLEPRPLLQIRRALEHEPAGRAEVQWLRASRGRHAGQQEPARPVGGRSDSGL